MQETGMAAATIGVAAIGEVITAAAVARGSRSACSAARLLARRSPRRRTLIIPRTATAMRIRPTDTTPTDRTTPTEPGLTPVFEAGGLSAARFFFRGMAALKNHAEGTYQEHNSG